MLIEISKDKYINLANILSITLVDLNEVTDDSEGFQWIFLSSVSHNTLSGHIKPSKKLMKEVFADINLKGINYDIIDYQHHNSQIFFTQIFDTAIEAQTWLNKKLGTYILGEGAIN